LTAYVFSFVLQRNGKSPLIFGAKTDLEMREWMIAIKLLADKLHTGSSIHDIFNSVGNTTASSRSQRRRLQEQSASPADACPPVAARRRSELPPISVSTNVTFSEAAKRDDALRRSTPQLMTLSSPSNNSPKIQQLANNSLPSPTKGNQLLVQLKRNYIFALWFYLRVHFVHAYTKLTGKVQTDDFCFEICCISYQIPSKTFSNSSEIHLVKYVEN
jgi:hypothetical protein